MCACRCGINVHLEQGKVKYIEGNKDHPVNKGVLCAKGSAGIMQHYSPARLKHPMRRVGPRGSGKFKKITWEEALTQAVNILEPIRKTHPEKLAFLQEETSPNHLQAGGHNNLEHQIMLLMAASAQLIWPLLVFIQWVVHSGNLEVLTGNGQNYL